MSFRFYFTRPRYCQTDSFRLAFFLFVFSVVITTKVIGQTPVLFEGTITYSVQSKGEILQPFKRMLPKQIKVSLNAIGARTETAGGYLNQIVVFDLFSARSLMLLNDSQQAVLVPSNTIMSTVKKDWETVTIAGYNCQKYTITYCVGKNYKPYTQSIWVAPGLKTTLQNSSAVPYYVFSGLLGFPLKIQMLLSPDSDDELTLTAIAVQKLCIDDNAVLCPANVSIIPFNAQTENLGTFNTIR